MVVCPKDISKCSTCENQSFCTSVDVYDSLLERKEKESKGFTARDEELLEEMRIKLGIK